jgi:small-conductance mechanosensitive channel
MKELHLDLAVLEGFNDEVWLALGLLSMILVALLIQRFVRRLMISLSRTGHIPPSMAKRVQQGSAWMLVLLVVTVFLQRTHIFEQAWAVLSAVMLATAVGFVALWSVMSNVVCAMFILFVRPFRLGDYIEILEPADEKRGVQGRVVDLSMMFTTIEVENSEQALVLCRVPNSVFFLKGVRVTIPKPLHHSASFYGQS